MDRLEVAMTVEEAPETEEVVTPEVETPETETETESKGLSHEEALKELEKVRREAAAKRVKNKELEEKAAKYDEYLKAQLSETERLQLELEEERATNRELKGQSARDKVISKYGLDPEMAQILLGDSLDEEELEKKAEALSNLAPREEKKKEAPKSFAGRRGAAVKPTEKDAPGFETFLMGAFGDLEQTRITFNT